MEADSGLDGFPSGISSAPIGPSQNTAYEMTGWQKLKSKIKFWYKRNIYKHIPHLVWPGQEVEVTVTFSQLPLGTPGIHFEELWKAEEALHKVGLSFDTGAGWDGRDWEWDWSLKGPVKVAFRRVYRGAMKGGEIVRGPRPLQTNLNPDIIQVEQILIKDLGPQIKEIGH